MVSLTSVTTHKGFRGFFFFFFGGGGGLGASDLRFLSGFL